MQLLRVLSVAIVMAGTVGIASADDVDPPPYRGESLSVFSEYDPDVSIENGDVIGDPFASLPLTPSSGNFDWVDDQDPSTFLFEDRPPQLRGAPGEEPSDGNFYEIDQPNIVDELPLKLLRVQVTWISPNPTGPDDTPIVTVNGFD